MLIVGSITTGNLRPRWCSHAVSGVTVTCSIRAAGSHCTRWETLGLHDSPYGDQASGLESVMNGVGITSAAGPPTPVRENRMWPARWYGTSPPPTLTVKVNDDAAAADSSVMLSLSAVGVTWYDKPAPAVTS